MGLVTTEVLVHVSAPSRPVDDARYRKEAQEYLRFEAACWHSVLDRHDDDTRSEGWIAPGRSGESPVARGSPVFSGQEQRTGRQSGTTREVKGCTRPLPPSHIEGRASRNSSEVLNQSPRTARAVTARHETAEALEPGNHGAEGDMSGCGHPDSFGDSFISDAGLAALETPAPRTLVRSSQEIKIALPPKEASIPPGRPFETPSAVQGPFFCEHTPIGTTPWSNIPRAKALFSIDVVRTPDHHLPCPRTAPSDHTIPVEIEPLMPCRAQSESDSWETPSAVIPDSQPSPLSLKRGSQASSGCDSTITRHEKKVRVERFSSPVGEDTSRIKILSSSIRPPVSLPQAQPRIFPSSPARRPRISNQLRGPTRVYRDPSPSADETTQKNPSSSPALPTPGSSKQPYLLPSSSLHHQPLPQPHRSPLLPLSSSPPPSSQEDHKILAPPPKPSSKPFKTHLTPSLAILTTKLPLLRFYTHLQFTPPLRSLRILERGHWNFPITSFSPSGWDTFWKYLKDFIGSGRASWGVWCVVERRSDLDSRKGDDCNNLDRGNVCKVYCWGEIVPEIWLLLFMASHRQIKGCGAAWIDAGGEIIVQMK